MAEHIDVDVAFSDLRKIISERSQPFVFWTGAGVSIPHTPSWRGLLNSLLKTAKLKAKTLSDSKALNSSITFAEQTNDLWLAFELLSSNQHGIGSESFRSVIREALTPSNSADLPVVQTMLWKLKPKGVVTLNLDLFTLRSSVSYSKEPATPIQILPGQFGQNINVFKEGRPFIAYPHGNFDNVDTWTFTSSSLSNRFSDKSYAAWMNALFASHVVIFVGLTVDDQAVGGLLDRISKQTEVSFKGNFWITSRRDSKTDSWAEERGIRVIRYNSSGDNHDGLLELLKNISDFRAKENTLLELPVSTTFVESDIVVLPAPEDIDLHNKERLRLLLNSYAQGIFSKYSEQPEERDRKFREFLTTYEDAVHNAYHTSILTGKNEFLGYTLARRANGGSFGSVYQAYDKDGNSVAIKILHAEKLGDVDFYRNFRRGVNSLRILRDRNVNGIVHFIAAAEIPPALIMEWIDGATLSEIVHASLLTEWRDQLVVMNRLANILRSSHGLPERVLHRDLRPANVMLKDFYTDRDKLDVVVLDFDLSWHRGAEDHSIMYSPALGYLAPEQRRRIPKSTTRTTLVDSYGIGMIMSFIVTGRDPIPDAHLIPSWKVELQRTLNSKPCRDLHCVPNRICRLIVSSTREEQNSRLEMSQIQGELQSLIDYIDNPTVLSSVSVLTEELAISTDTLRSYVWDEQNSRATYQITEEKVVSLQADIANNEIMFNFMWQNSGTQEWSQINRLLEKGFPHFVEALKLAGWRVSHTKASRTFNVSATISALHVVGNIEAIAKGLDKAILHTSAM